MKRISLSALGLAAFLALMWIILRVALYGGERGKIVYSEWAGDPDNPPDIHVTNALGFLHPRLASPAISASWSPDGKQIVYECKPPSYSWNICIMSDDGSNQRQLTFATEPAEYRFPVWSPDGKEIAFEYSTRLLVSEFFVIKADGSGLTQITSNGCLSTDPFWSPDGKRLAFVLTKEDNNSEIYTMNADGSDQVNIIADPSFDNQPIWSKDGTHIFFTSDRTGDLEIYRVNTDGSGLINLTNNPLDESTPEISPDGQTIAFTVDLPQPDDDLVNSDIYTMKTDGTERRQLTDTPDFEYAPVWSPDGKNIAFISSRSGTGKWAVYVMKANGQWQTRITFGISVGGIAWQP